MGGGAAIDQRPHGRAQRPRRRRHRRLHHLARGALERRGRPVPGGRLTKRSSHLWRADLPADLAAGVHTLEVSTTDRYGRTFRVTSTFEVVETIPEMGWNGGF